MKLDHVDHIGAIEETIDRVVFPNLEFRLDLKSHPNIRKEMDIDVLKAERPPIHFDMEKFLSNAKAISWGEDESIEQLLADLKW